MIWKLKLISAVVIVVAFGTLSGVAMAQSDLVKTDNIEIDGGKADFGSGIHGTGHPFEFGHVKWAYSSAGGSLVANASVDGTLYYDSLDTPGCARLVIKFEDSSHTVLSQKTIDTTCPAPGGDANLSANKKVVVASFAGSDLKYVVLQTQTGQPVSTSTTTSSVKGEGTAVATTSSFGDVQHTSEAKTSEAPGIKKYDVKINNGSADFGNGLHALGGPSGNGVVQLSRVDGNVTGLVNGTLYYDALVGAGCARLIVDFMNFSGSVLNTKTIDQCGPGGNANDSKKDINETYANGLLWRIRITTGVVVNNNLINTESKTCDFRGCN